jgi:hypothetical protein
MHEVNARITRAIGVCAAAVLSCAGIASAQLSPPPELAPTGLLNAVLSYRLAVVESSAVVRACSVLKLMDTPRDFPHAFSTSVQKSLDRRESPCEPVTKPALDSTAALTMRDLRSMPVDPGCVTIDSVRRADSLATVYASAIRQGDAVHSEEFRASCQPRRKEWVVTDVRLYGLWYPHGAGCP